jgi:Ca2+-binding RTX toxin-like protein
MAKLSMFPQHPDGYYAFSNLYSTVLGPRGPKSAVYTEYGDDGDYAVLKGSGLKYNGGELVKGIITSMTLYDAEGAKLCAITGINFNAKLIDNFEGYWQYAVSGKMLSGSDRAKGSGANDALAGYGGNDTLSGKGGADYLSGGPGKDRLTGGAGADQFSFNAFDAHDIITDFNSDGSNFDTHDRLIAYGTSYDVKQIGKNTLVQFDNGSSVTLLNFRKADLDDEDISMFRFKTRSLAGECTQGGCIEVRSFSLSPMLNE